MHDLAENYAVTNHNEQTDHQLYVKVGTSIKLVEMANIVCAQAAGNYVGIVMVTGETIHAKETISHIAARMPGDLFVRIHRSYVVNIRYIRELKSRQNNYELTLMNDMRVLSGTTYRKYLRKRFSARLGRGNNHAANRLFQDTADSLGIFGNHKLQGSSDLDIHIRICAAGDEYALTFLGKITFMQTYMGLFDAEGLLAHCGTHDALTTYRNWLENKAAQVWIVETGLGNIPVGYMVLAPPTMPLADVTADDLEIHRVYILKAFQGRGLGRDLVARAVEHAKQTGCRRLLLGDFRENSPAIAFYERLGFQPVGEYPCQVGNRVYKDIVFGMKI